MPSIYQLKSRFQSLLRPVVVMLAQRGVTANQVTLMAIGLSVVAGVFFSLLSDWQWPWLLLPLVLLIRMALNAIDGMLAREHNMKSPLGAVLNELGDVVSDVALYLPFAWIAGVTGWLVGLVCMLAVFSEMAGIIGVQIGASRRYDGPMGKSDRALLFGLLGALLGVGIATGMWVNLVFMVAALLLMATIYNRLCSALKEVSINVK